MDRKAMLAPKELPVLPVPEESPAILDHLDLQVFPEFKAIRVTLVFLEKREQVCNNEICFS